MISKSLKRRHASTPHTRFTLPLYSAFTLPSFCLLHSAFFTLPSLCLHSAFFTLPLLHSAFTLPSLCLHSAFTLPSLCLHSGMYQLFRVTTLGSVYPLSGHFPFGVSPPFVSETFPLCHLPTRRPSPNATAPRSAAASFTKFHRRVRNILREVRAFTARRRHTRRRRHIGWRLVGMLKRACQSVANQMSGAALKSPAPEIGARVRG